MPTTPAHRRSRTTLLLALAMILTMVATIPGAFANHAGNQLQSVFEATDGNLTPQPGTGHPDSIDWNSFATDEDLATAWNFTSASDDTGNSDGTIFTKNTKSHQFECANVGSGSMGGGGNKDDLKRMYLAHQKIGNADWLFLSWVRVNQNSTTASANLSFEFNQSEESCADSDDYTGTRSSDLKVRTDGDMLILYDFYGGEGRVEIFLSEWTSDGPCEVSNHPKPCWGPVNNLTAGSVAEGSVNVAGPVNDAHQGVGTNVGTVAFGEAAINLTGAGVFDGGSCRSFGSALGISRSSGNSISSSLSDYIGPKGFNLSNCGSIRIVKEDDQTQAQPVTGATFLLFTDDGDGNPDEPVITRTFEGTLVQEKLASAIDDEAAAFSTVTAPGAGWPSGDHFVAIGSEVLRVGTRSGPDFTGVQRGQVGTTAAAHAAGADVGLIVQCTTALVEGVAECTMPNIRPDDYVLVEAVVPVGYNGADPTPVTVDLGGNRNAVRTITNPRAPASLEFLKRDDDGVGMAGVTFYLWEADDPTATGFDPLEDTKTSYFCTTQAASAGPPPTDAGLCRMININDFGTYWIVEDDTPSGYSTAAPYKVVISAGDEIVLTGPPFNHVFVNTQLHRAVVAVCHTATNELHDGEVTLKGNPNIVRSTIGSIGLQLDDLVDNPDDRAEILDRVEEWLCSATGFDSLAHGGYDLELEVKSHTP